MLSLFLIHLVTDLFQSSYNVRSKLVSIDYTALQGLNSDPESVALTLLICRSILRHLVFSESVYHAVSHLFLYMLQSFFSSL